MPRNGKGQAKMVAPNQPYGTGVQQLAAQDTQRLPDTDFVSQVPTRAQPSRERLVEMATEFAGPLEEGLAAPSGRPTQPVTAGLSVGAGPGPEALLGSRTRRSASKRVFSNLAESLGDPRLRRLADPSR